MKIPIVISDFDGVIGDSLEIALILTRKMVRILDCDEEVHTFSDYYRLFGSKSAEKILSDKESETFRELHRILIRHNSNHIILIKNIIEIYTKLVAKPIIVSSTYADVIKKVIGNFDVCFELIYGFESGHKRIILDKMKEKYDFYYVTDTFRDIEICKELDIPVIATCWGYDTKEVLKAGKPDYLANNFVDLENILTELNLIGDGK